MTTRWGEGRGAWGILRARGEAAQLGQVGATRRHGTDPVGRWPRACGKEGEWGSSSLQSESGGGAGEGTTLRGATAPAWCVPLRRVRGAPWVGSGAHSCGGFCFACISSCHLRLLLWWGGENRRGSVEPSRRCCLAPHAARASQSRRLPTYHVCEDKQKKKKRKQGRSVITQKPYIQYRCVATCPTGPFPIQPSYSVHTTSTRSLVPWKPDRNADVGTHPPPYGPPSPVPYHRSGM